MPYWLGHKVCWNFANWTLHQKRFALKFLQLFYCPTDVDVHMKGEIGISIVAWEKKQTFVCVRVERVE